MASYKKPTACAIGTFVNHLDLLGGDAVGWLKSIEQGSISSEGASQCLFAGKNRKMSSLVFSMLAVCNGIA
ncbi:hypothetical protein RIF29_20946 [Crotalaria pallida]|uniref:Uncharacterized protein n=1 Tax=Crotalaria pallida TaxID=3830 RepID=A0AAN9F3J5_CROPI